MSRRHPKGAYSSSEGPCSTRELVLPESLEWDNRSVDPRYSEEDYERGERTSDRIVGLWLLAIVLPALPAALIANLAGIDMLLVMIPLEIVTIAAFLSWARTKTKDLPPQRQAIRPIRWRWIARPLLIALTLLAILFVLALMGSPR